MRRERVGKGGGADPVGRSVCSRVVDSSVTRPNSDDDALGTEEVVTGGMGKVKTAPDVSGRNVPRDSCLKGESSSGMGGGGGSILR